MIDGTISENLDFRINIDGEYIDSNGVTRQTVRIKIWEAESGEIIDSVSLYPQSEALNWLLDRQDY